MVDMRIDSPHAETAMRVKNIGELCPELKIVAAAAKPLLIDIAHQNEIKSERIKKRLIDVSLEHQFILIGLNVRVTRAEYMGENYDDNA